MHDYRRLEVWEEGVALAEEVYRLTAGFPQEERFGLAAQLRSAAISISSNISEGAGRGSPREMSRFLRISLGSVYELETQLTLAIRLGYLEASEVPLRRVGILGRRIKRLHDRITGARP